MEVAWEQRHGSRGSNGNLRSDGCQLKQHTSSPVATSDRARVVGTPIACMASAVWWVAGHTHAQGVSDTQRRAARRTQHAVQCNPPKCNA